MREIGKLGSVYLQSFPNFPNSAEPDGLVSFGKLGNWEMSTSSHFPISQFPKSCWPIEIGKLGSMYLQTFPNSAEPDGLRSFGKLGNWEICISSHFPISQIVLAHLGWCLLGNWEIGNSTDFPISQTVLSQMAEIFWDIGKFVPQAISQFPK